MNFQKYAIHIVFKEIYALSHPQTMSSRREQRGEGFKMMTKDDRE